MSADREAELRSFRPGGKGQKQVSRYLRSAGAALVVLTGVLAGGCAVAADPQPGPTVASVPPSEQPPAIAAVLGQAKEVRNEAGDVASVKLNGVRYPRSDDEQQLAVVDLSITGASKTPFQYAESDVDFAYADKGSPYTHNGDDNVYGPDPTEDYTSYLPPKPLRVGEVSAGHTVRGLVILRMSTGRTPYILYLTDDTGTDLAAWSLTPPR